MAKISIPKLNLADLQTSVREQFTGLNPNDPGTWPLVPKLLTCLGVVVLICVLLWLALISGAQDELREAEKQESILKQDYKKKLAQAINLEALRKQREQVQQYVTQLEKQLPGRADMDALLFDINQAGAGRNLQFEHFKPGSVDVKAYYAELPISMRVTGKYHDIGAFAADIANLSRIVTLNNLSLAASKDGSLTMDCVAKTFRYLDNSEVDAQRKPAAGGKK
ncbi:MAG: type 4a pilus biosis protein PilO [Pseudomonadota bacterium]|jgi:type IV pilus assembly protein PilO